MSTRPLRRASGYFGVRLPLFRSRDAVHGLASHLRIIIPEPSPQPAGTSEDLSQGQSSRGPSHQESSSKLPRRPALVPLISRPPFSRRVAAVRLSPLASQLWASQSRASGSEMNCPAPSGLLETGRGTTKKLSPSLYSSGQQQKVTTPNRSSNPISNTCIASVVTRWRNSGGNRRLAMPETPFADTNSGGPLSTDRCICRRQICRTRHVIAWCSATRRDRCTFSDWATSLHAAGSLHAAVLRFFKRSCPTPPCPTPPCPSRPVPSHAALHVGRCSLLIVLTSF